MLRSFLPRQEEFFTLLEQIAGCLMAASEALYQEIHQLEQPLPLAEQVLVHKRNAGAHAQRLFTLMHKTFITPFDRYDIHRLNDKLYDIANMINLTAQRFPRYQVQQVPTMMVTLADICYKSTQLIKQVISHLRDLRNNSEIAHACNQIKAYESHADQLLIDGIAALLNDETDIKTIFKLKEIYDLLESITDRCQEVAFIVEGIVLEYA